MKEIKLLVGGGAAVGGGGSPSEVRGKDRGEMREVFFWNHLILYRAGKLSTLCTLHLPHHHMLP